MISPSAISRILKRAALVAAAIAGTVLVMPDARAQTPRSQPLRSQLRPGQSAESVGPAATITSTVHYQVALLLTCSGAECVGNFPRPGRNRLITVTHLSCAFSGDSGSTIGLDRADVLDGKGTISAEEYLPIDYTNAQDYNLINQAIDVQIAGTQHLQVTMFFEFGEAVNGACTASGTLSTLG